MHKYGYLKRTLLSQDTKRLSSVSIVNHEAVKYDIQNFEVT